MYYKPPKNLKVRAYVKNYDEIIKDRDLEIIILQQRIDKAYNSLGILLQILEEQSGDKDIKWILERLNPIQEILGDKQ